MLLIVNLLGGIGLFLLGMTMLTDGLKLAAGGALERILAAWTRTRLYGLLTGILVTALVQSSTAMTVAAIGFVNAGLLSFTSALWVVFGSNLGSSVTGWLVALIGFKFKIDAFALPFIGVGMALKLSGEGTRRGGLGGTLAGFGLLFLGIDLLKEGFGGLSPADLPEMGRDLGGMLTAVLIGLLLTIILQASSATLTIALTAVAGGMVTLEIAAAIVIGANIGTTLTGIVAAINATPNARRLAAAHVFFNVVTAVVAFALLSPLLKLIHYIGVQFVGDGNPVTQLVIFHTGFNALGVLLMWPLSTPLVRFLQGRFQTVEEDELRPRYLDMNVASVPALALQALRRELARMGHLALQLATDATQLNPAHLPRTVPPPQSETRLARKLAVVEQLQKQIGSFVSQMSRQPLHQDVADKLPELLRIATHFDTLSRVMYHVGVLGAHDVRTVELGALASNRHPAGIPGGIPAADLPTTVAPVFLAALAFFKAADPESEARSAEGKWLASEARDAFEDTYQATKAHLLHAGAGGQFQVTEVYDWLARLSDLRRAVEQGHKASQRLSAMSDLAPTPTVASEVPPFRETVPAEPSPSKPDAVADNPL
ncbi:MAG: Na/Pi symporter [Aquabacterium sp.]|jgi:phosphate:Na+ symporter|uniref:Na/Pi cotransporter family protein n=1 Tax=Aquabacterium sp. TaxID=1872578 RepID=UPI002A36D710|nr:Na/Pi symporter [Aquabacterium sp.]MDX9842739.1 Na/Pi symporter [Aquabacterium sp.]